MPEIVEVVRVLTPSFIELISNQEMSASKTSLTEMIKKDFLDVG